MSGIKITKPGKDVSSTNLGDFVFHSDYPTRTIKKRDSLNVTSSDAQFPNFVRATYNHNFGYVPQFIAFTKSYSSENFGKFGLADFVNLNLYLINEIAGANQYEEVYAFTTDTQLVVDVKLTEVVAGDEQGIEYEYTIDFILFMEEASPLD